MNSEELKKKQKAARQERLNAILVSKAKKKLIVAGAGTGKTFTFGELLKARAAKNNLAMTFIRKLIDDMEAKLSAFSEVKTFHAFCKKVLHEKNGKVEIAPYLTKVVEKDSNVLGAGFSDFDAKFQTLDESHPALKFHLARGNYYDAVGFDDAVYRLYRLLRDDPSALPSFNQIVVDEFQDFHALEVALIDELSKKGDILIVGDDDQAVYDGRNASARHLRERFSSPEFEKFELPFCSRCPKVIVDAANYVLSHAQKTGRLAGRIPRNYECYWEDKEADSVKYPRIVTVKCTTASIVARYIESEIAKIDPKDVAESRKKDAEYPTVLVVGSRQYLKEVDKLLRKSHPHLVYKPSSEIGYGISDGYEWLLRDPESNLGWRIVGEVFLTEEQLTESVKLSMDGRPFVTTLNAAFVDRQKKALDLVRSLAKKERTLEEIQFELRDIVGAFFEELVTRFSPKEKSEPEVVDANKPTILLTSYVGCKGLSAGHVFIVGVHEESMPRNGGAPEDTEIGQFVVALTRTRKQCHVVSNEWLIAPVDRKKAYIAPYKDSVFLSWIPSDLFENRGKVNAKSFNAKK